MNQIAIKSHANTILKDASILPSDEYFIRTITGFCAKVVNVSIGNVRPVLSLFSYFSQSHRAYQNELNAIAKLPSEKRGKICQNTFIYGGETEKEYTTLISKFDEWKKTHQNKFETRVIRHTKTDSLDAAVAFKKANYTAKIVISNFANAVHVGGADNRGGKGSQEENLFRTTYLRVSLEEAERRINQNQTDKKLRALTGRYIKYYGAVVSKEVPTIKRSNEEFGFVSATAPDLRKRRAEGKYFALQSDPTLIREVLYRKLVVVLMAAAMEGFDTVVLGAFGCGAFGNSPAMVSEVMKNILEEDRFKGVFSHIIFPIGQKDPNYLPFSKLIGHEP